VREGLGGRGTETLVGVALVGEALAVIGAENRMALRRHSVLGDEAGVWGAEGTGIVIVTTITGGYRHLEGTVILHRLPDVVDAEATVGEVGEGRETRDLVVRPAETPDMIELSADPVPCTRRGVLCGIFHIG